MFTRTRWRLVLWNVLMLGTVLAVVGAVIYLALTRSLMNEVDRNLANRGEEVAANLREIAEGEIILGQPGYQGGLFYLLMASDGTIVANPQRISMDTLPAANVDGTVPHYVTLEVNDEPIRVYTRPLISSGRRGPLWLSVGQSLAPELRDIQRLKLVLFIGGGVGLIFSLVAAWFLSGRAIDPVRRAYQRQQEFAADASHELRTPLAVLRSSTDLLAQHQDDPLRINIGLLEDAREEIRRMERLVDDLLTLTRSDMEQLHLALGDVNITTLAQEVMEKMQAIAQGRGIALAYQGTQEPVTTYADPDRLEQVVMILLDNALNYTQNGGSVALSVRRDGNSILLGVADTGKGIAPDHLQHVFERFFRADQARSTNQNSTGLGLPIAKSLIEAHGGKIAISSTLGKGTMITVRLASASHSM